MCPQQTTKQPVHQSPGQLRVLGLRGRRTHGFGGNRVALASRKLMGFVVIDSANLIIVERMIVDEGQEVGAHRSGVNKLNN